MLGHSLSRSALCLLCLAAACTTPLPGDDGTSSGMGSISASVQLVRRSGGPAITRVQIEVQPAAVYQSLAYNSATGEYTGTVVVPSGTQTITASAYAGAELVGSGSATVVVSNHGAASVVIKILDNSTTPTPQDHGPIITSATATSVFPLVGEVISLQVTAIDPDSDPIAYQWSQDCGGTFGSPLTASTNWSNTIPENCVLTVTATSRGLSDVARISVAVGEGSGSVGLAAVFVPSPFIRSIALSGGGLSCTVPRSASDASCRPAIAQTTFLTAIVAFDPLPSDSGATVSLSNSCGGSSTAGTLDLPGGSATFTWTAPVSSGACLLTATVSREGLADSQSVAVAIL